MAKFKSTSYDDEQIESEKRRRLIELAFGPDTTTHEDPVIGQLEVPEIPYSQVENFTKVVASDMAKSACNKSQILEESEDKLVQKIEKIEETPLVEVEHKNADELKMNNKTTVWSSRKDTSKECQPGDTINIFDEVAKRCLDLPSDKIDTKLLEQMERLGVLQTVLKPDSPKVEDETVQIGPTRRTRKPSKKKEVELETYILDRETIKMPRRNFVNRRAMRHIALNMGSYTFGGPQQLKTDIVMKQDENKITTESSSQPQLENKTESNECTQSADRNISQEESSQYRNFSNSPIVETTKDSITVEKIAEIPYEPKSPATLLSDEYADDPDCAEKRYKQAGQSELVIGLEEIKRIFGEDNVPLHTLVNLNTSQIHVTGKTSNASKKTHSQRDLERHIYYGPPHSHYYSSSYTTIDQGTKLPSETFGSKYVSTESAAVPKVPSNDTETEVVYDDDEIKNPNDTTDQNRDRTQSDNVLNKTIDNVAEIEASQSPMPHINIQKPELNYKDNISLSELLRRVRQRARLETLEQYVLTSQVTETDPSVDQKRPPCAPLATPPNPRVLPPRPCPGPRKKQIENNRCQPSKKNKCEKFRRNTLVDAFGVVMRRVPEIDVPENWPDRTDKEPIPKASTVMFVSKLKSFVKGVNNVNIPNRILSERVLNFIRDYDPWGSASHKKK